MRKAIVTGASGFVGRALCGALPGGWHGLSLGAPDWERALGAAPLEGATIFHLAARVHDPDDRDASAFERDNAGKSRRLAEAAARAGARRIVFLSTIKVHGEESPTGRPYAPQDEPAPADPYARSKLAAERALTEVCRPAGVELAIVRSTLVLGPGARGNVESLMRVVDTPWPLPFAAIANRRSFVHRDDLVRLLLACAASPAAAGATFTAAHRLPASTAALVAALRRALGRPARLFAVPAPVLELAAAALGQGGRMRRLTRSLEVDPSAAERALGWIATTGLDESAAQMGAAWKRGWR